jgi:NitT/TauT family transport system permease protein
MSGGTVAATAPREMTHAAIPTRARASHATNRDRLVVAAILIATWHGLSVSFGTYWIPSPWTTLSRLAADIASGNVVRHALYTVSEAFLGFVFGGAPAVGLPFALRRRPVVTAIFEPFMAGGYGVPKLALAPLFILWFGIGIASKVALVAISAFFILYFNTMAGVRAMEPRLASMARVAGARERDVARHIVLPGAVPYILTGVRVALLYSIGGAVVAELLSANRGLGYLVQISATSFDTTGVFVALAMIGVIVLAGNWTINSVEQRLLRHVSDVRRD